MLHRHPLLVDLLTFDAVREALQMSGPVPQQCDLGRDPVEAHALAPPVAATDHQLTRLAEPDRRLGVLPEPDGVGSQARRASKRASGAWPARSRATSSRTRPSACRPSWRETLAMLDAALDGIVSERERRVLACDQPALGERVLAEVRNIWG